MALRSAPKHPRKVMRNISDPTTINSSAGSTVRVSTTSVNTQTDFGVSKIRWGHGSEAVLWVEVCPRLQQHQRLTEVLHQQEGGVETCLRSSWWFIIRNVISVSSPLGSLLPSLEKNPTSFFPHHSPRAENVSKP